jgi:hypothetical protein
MEGAHSHNLTVFQANRKMELCACRALSNQIAYHGRCISLSSYSLRTWHSVAKLALSNTLEDITGIGQGNWPNGNFWQAKHQKYLQIKLYYTLPVGAA